MLDIRMVDTAFRMNEMSVYDTDLILRLIHLLRHYIIKDLEFWSGLVNGLWRFDTWYGSLPNSESSGGSTMDLSASLWLNAYVCDADSMLTWEHFDGPGKIEFHGLTGKREKLWERRKGSTLTRIVL
jgi:hypothetical protein